MSEKISRTIFFLLGMAVARLKNYIPSTMLIDVNKFHASISECSSTVYVGL